MENKIWIGGDSNGAGDYSIAANWKPIIRRSAAYKWTASSSGTNEYYLELAAGGDPSQEAPTDVQLNGTDATEGTAGSLAAGEWDYGDNDTLGFNTLYVRLADGADPDSKDVGYVTYTAIPVAGDAVTVPASSTQAINDGLDQSAVAIASFTVEAGYSKAIGSSAAPLRIDPDALSFAGTGVAYLDIGTAAISPHITATASVATGRRGLYLTGSAMVTLTVAGGSVGVAAIAGQTSTVAAIRVSGSGNVRIGAGATVTALYVTAGQVVCYASVTTATVQGGIVETAGNGAITTLHAYGGTIYASSAGTIGTANLDGARLDLLSSKVTRAVTTLNYLSGTLAYDPNVVTITNRTLATRPVTYSTL